MKKQMIGGLCAMMALTAVLAGCGETGNGTSTVVSSGTQSSDAASSVSSAQTGVTVTDGKRTRGDNKEWQITYPIFSGLNNESKVNTRILEDTMRDDLLLVSAEEGQPLPQGSMDYKIIHQDDKVVSIAYTGSLTAEGSAHPSNLVFTVNVDVQTGERFDTGVRENAAALAGILVSGEGYALEGDFDLQKAIISYLKEQDLQLMSDLIAKADFDATDSDSIPPVFSAYLPDGKVLLYVPVPHALGDFAAITMALPQDGQNTQSSASLAGASSQPESQLF